jgi:hypothetical protein
MPAGTSRPYTAKIRRGGMGTGMPYWGSIFTEEEMEALVSYVWTFSLGSTDQLRRQATAAGLFPRHPSYLSQLPNCPIAFCASEPAAPALFLPLAPTLPLRLVWPRHEGRAAGGGAPPAGRLDQAVGSTRLA